MVVCVGRSDGHGGGDDSFTFEMSDTRSARRRANVNLWRVPLALTAGAVALFALTMVPDTLDTYGVIHLPTWLTMGGIDDARAILSAMLGCVSTVLALIFSVALLVLSMVATLFGPRLLYRFLQDWTTQVTLGVFLGTFVYLCLVFLVTHQDAHTTFIPQVSLITGWLLVIVSFGFLVFYSHRIATSIQNPDMVARIVDDLRASVQVRVPSSGDDLAPETIAQHMREGEPILASESGYVQEINHSALIAAATEAQAVIHVRLRPGQFTLAREPIAFVWPASRGAALADAIHDHVALGRHRTLRQDSEFAIAQIVEIAIRALSPAVNDTFTGVACVDWIGDALLVLADAPPPQHHWADDKGETRLRVRPLPLARLIKVGFDQIRQSATDNPAVLVRMLDMARRIAPRMPGDEERRALLDQTTAIKEAAASATLVQVDRDDIETAWRGATASAAPR
jgi:uncharacterized membrane protein